MSLLSKKRHKDLIEKAGLLLLFLAINALFLLKYGMRISPYYYLFPVFYAILALGLLVIVLKITDRNERFTKILFPILVLGGFIGISFSHWFINPESVDVDRWSAIYNFWEYLFAGKFPYNAPTHLNGYGSPFPIWQLFHLPFYLLGDIGFGMIFSFLILAFALFRFVKEKRVLNLYLLLLLISPAFWYEVFVRSDLIYNFFWVLIVCMWIWDKKQTTATYPIRLGAIAGLFLATRLAIILPFFILLYPGFSKSGLRNQLVFISTILIVFAAAFLPFLVWDYEALLYHEYNPFILQSRQGSIFEIIAVGLFTFFMALTWKSNFEKYASNTAFALIALIVVSFLHRMIDADFQDSLFSASFDITYFNMALVFLILPISKFLVKKA